MAKRKDTDDKAEMRKRYKAADDACTKDYGECVDDIEFAFVPGKQWDAAMKVQRGTRPTYEFNKTRPVVKSITNDMRQNSPALKIRATEDGKKELAEIMMGLVRNIEAQSRADTAYDTAGFFAAAGGYGVFEIATEYSNDDAFDLDIRIKEKRNPFAIKFDPAAKEFDKRDGRFAFEELTYFRDEFKAKWPDADPCDFSPSNSAITLGDGWATEKLVRVVKYWCKHKAKKTIYQLSDGRVLDEDDYQAILPQLIENPEKPKPSPYAGMAMATVPQNVAPEAPQLWLQKTREVSYDRITVEICSGKETLEGPFDWAGKFIPLVPVWGESVNVEGKEYYAGAARPIKDAQRLFNWDVCIGQETMASQPRAPFVLTAAMVEGYEDAWKNLAVDNAPALFYNPDPTQPGGPRRENPPAFPAGFFNSAQFASDLIKSVSNVVDAPIQSRASSGKAIQAVEHQQDVGNFDYIDNLARAKAFGGEILVDLIPRIYDTERQVMILGPDGAESYKKLNETVRDPMTGRETILNDLSQAKFAVTVTIGPSYATSRMETLDMLKELAGLEGMGPMVADLIAKNMDFKGSEELYSRLRKAGIKSGMIEPDDDDEAPQGPPPEVQQAMQQIQEAGQQLQAEKAEVNAAKVQVEAAQKVLNADVAKAKAEIQNMLLKGQQQAAQQPQEPAQAQPAANGAGEAAVALANTQANQQLVVSLAPLVDSMQSLVAGMAQVAPALIQTSENNALANAPKQKVGRMIGPDGRVFQIEVVESA